MNDAPDARSVTDEQDAVAIMVVLPEQVKAGIDAFPKLGVAFAIVKRINGLHHVARFFQGKLRNEFLKRLAAMRHSDHDPRVGRILSLKVAVALLPEVVECGRGVKLRGSLVFVHDDLAGPGRAGHVAVVDAVKVNLGKVPSRLVGVRNPLGG